MWMSCLLSSPARRTCVILPPSISPFHTLLTSRHLQQRQAQVIADEGKEGGAGREGGTGRFKSLSDEPETNQAGGLVVGVSGR